MTNPHSCVLDSLCYVLSLDPVRVAEEIGHDGRDKGFHIQEFVDFLEKRGRALTPIERYPVSLDYRTYEERPIFFPDRFGNEQRFIKHLYLGYGILTGVKRSYSPHAVAWIDGKAFDPANGLKYPLLEFDGLKPISIVPDPPFFAKCFWRMLWIT